MDIFGINKKVNKLLAQELATMKANDFASLNNNNYERFLQSNALPTINSDTYDYEDPFKTVGAVYETTDIISKKIISSPLMIYKVRDKRKLQESKRLFKSGDLVGATVFKQMALEEVDAPNLREVLNSPNNYQTGKQFLWGLSLSYLLNGNAYVHGVKGEKSEKPFQLYSIPEMNILTNTTDMLDPISGYRVLFGGKEYDFEKRDIHHFKTGNPSKYTIAYEYLYGVSPLRAYLESLRTLSEAQAQASKQMKNGGVFGILSPKAKEDQFSTAQRQDLHDRMKRARLSNDELSRIFASSITLQWQEIGLKSADLQLIEQLKVSQADIYRCYHVPFTYLTNDASSYNNESTAVRKLIYDAVAPVADSISEGLTEFVGKPFGDYIVEIDYTQLPEMAVNMKDISDYIIPLVEKGIISRDEARFALRYGELDTDVSKGLFYGKDLLTIRNN